jgi:hypothetical protein
MHAGLAHLLRVLCADMKPFAGFHADTATMNLIDAGYGADAAD